MRATKRAWRCTGLAALAMGSAVTMTTGLATAQILDAHENRPVLSPITNRWGEAETTKVDAEHFEIFRGEVGAAFSQTPSRHISQ